MNEIFLFRILLLAIFIIVLAFWGWRWLKGTAGSPKGWVTTLVAILLLSLFAPSLWQKIDESGITITSSGIPVTQPMVRMKLEWVLPPDQLDRGINSDILDVVITKNEASDLWFETPYKKDGRMEVARYYLKKDGDKLSGSWSQNNPQDGGTLYLKKSGDQWIGQIVDRTERSSVINLRQ